MSVWDSSFLCYLSLQGKTTTQTSCSTELERIMFVVIQKTGGITTEPRKHAGKKKLSGVGLLGLAVTYPLKP